MNPVSHFKKVYLEISNICNLQCTFCPVVERDQKVMALDEIKKYLSQVKPYAERVCFHVMGEPLNHPQFPQAIALAQDISVPIEITTNGTLLTPTLMEALLAPTVIQVNFSLQSFVDNFPNANPETYFQKILQFCTLAQTQRPDLYINFRFWNLGPGERQNQINEFFLNKIEEFFKTKLNRNVDPGFKKSKNISGRVYAHFDSRFEWPNAKDPVISTHGTCWGARSQIAIHANGKVVPCCLDKEADILIGNVHTESFESILKGRPFTEIKEGFEKNRLVADLCQRCTFRTRFQTETSMTV